MNARLSVITQSVRVNARPSCRMPPPALSSVVPDTTPPVTVI